MPSPIPPALADTGGEASPDAIGRSESESCEESVFALKSIEIPSFWLESVRPMVRNPLRCAAIASQGVSPTASARLGRPRRRSAASKMSG